MSDELVNFEVGESAPDFEAELTDGTTIRLSEILHGGEKVILYSVSYTHLTLPTTPYV